MSQKNEKMRAAIVDDEKDLCLLLENMLRHQQFNTISINTLQELSEKIVPLQPDVIFLDNHLPDGSGIRCIPWIRKKLPKAKIVMMTAYNNGNEWRGALENGADIFLMKPLTRSAIEETLIKLDIRHTA